MKKIFFIILMIVIIIISIIIIKKNSTVTDLGAQEDYREPMEDIMQISEDGTISNGSEILKKTIQFEGLDITNIEISEKIANKVSEEGYNQKVVITVKNNSDQDKEEFDFRMNIITKAGMLISQVTGKIPEIAKGEEKEVVITDLEQPIDYLDIGNIEFTKN